MSNPRVRKRTKAQRAAQCEELAEQYARGMSQKALAKKFNLSQSQVSKDLTAYFGKLAESQKSESIKVLMAKQLVRLRDLMRTCWEAWEDSRKPKETQTVEKLAAEGLDSGQTDAGNGQKTPRRYTKTRYRRETRDGSPAFLRLIFDSIDRECKLLGLYSESVRNRLSAGDSKPIQFIEVVKAPESHIPIAQAESAPPECGLYVI